ncbi:citrate lyase holo-[acyl-carrier protein] synthase [Clostridium tarantellae]|uniref:citrate lyase holo-[acyl-carrier protein] synthase n=1 Tax=Clostridium tarantellae TaxID=39493 RepID=A0A6I1MNX3_9CLOT|nr:citrate lyase holo-[acyl-carrier protein] synthase [Clostridium tarantellae]MPQ43817.1 citrate lyase holo-[acyl-carrier protein] synthase [Clostridium tarantellae]
MNSFMNSEKMKLLEEILKGKEERVELQKKLIYKYNKTLVSFSLNIPGLYKVKNKYLIIFNAGIEALIKEAKKQKLEILDIKENITKAGFDGFLVVNADAYTVKKMTIFIEENHSLGRLFDLDVFDNNFNQISRTKFGVGKRKCLICDNEANVCRRESNHLLEEVLNKINILINEYII